jgi:hypothetical protein
LIYLRGSFFLPTKNSNDGGIMAGHGMNKSGAKKNNRKTKWSENAGAAQASAKQCCTQSCPEGDKEKEALVVGIAQLK